MPYRTAAAEVEPKTFTELFAVGASLRAGDDLSFEYEVLPWKRIVASLRHRPPSVADFLLGLCRRFVVSVQVLEAEDLEPGPYALSAGDRVVFRSDLVRLEGPTPTHSFRTLDRVSSALVRAGASRFAIEDGACIFRVSGYHATDLADRFERTHGRVVSDLPPLVNRRWQRVRV
jgi:hypothetical protein